MAKKYSVIYIRENEYTIYLISKFQTIPDETLTELKRYFHKDISFTYDKRINFEDMLDRSYPLYYVNGNFEASAFANYMIDEAVKLSATDIHMLCQNKTYIVKLRLNQSLKTWCVLGENDGQALMRVIKIKAGLPISRTVSPIEGRFDIQKDKEPVSFRVSILPTVTGEKLSIRVLGNIKQIYTFEDLGLDIAEMNLLKNAIDKKSGFIVITGPTGCGKSTTVFTALHYLNSGDKNIISIEDPVEYIIDGVTQLNISKEKSINFEDIFKFVLRQDPDVINIGEVRDKLTAMTAIDAAQTGHLVFSTLHTKSAADAAVRLCSFGADPVVLSENLSLIISQRIVRVLCNHCKTEALASLDDRKKFHIREDAKIYRAAGCQNCNYIGYMGLKPVFEMLAIDKKAKDIISDGNLEELGKGIKTVKDKIFELVEKGETSLEEAKKYM